MTWKTKLAISTSPDQWEGKRRLTTQAINPVDALRLYNQLKISPAVPDELVPMNAKRPKLEVNATDQIGSPPGVHFRKILGALPSSERARRVREAAYCEVIATIS